VIVNRSILAFMEEVVDLVQIHMRQNHFLRGYNILSKNKKQEDRDGIVSVVE
jgi:hypothetical protein